jgi:hypothetical protein
MAHLIQGAAAFRYFNCVGLFFSKAMALIPCTFVAASALPDNRIPPVSEKDA